MVCPRHDRSLPLISGGSLSIRPNNSQIPSATSGTAHAHRAAMPVASLSLASAAADRAGWSPCATGWRNPETKRKGPWGQMERPAGKHPLGMAPFLAATTVACQLADTATIVLPPSPQTQGVRSLVSGLALISSVRLNVKVASRFGADVESDRSEDTMVSRPKSIRTILLGTAAALAISTVASELQAQTATGSPSQEVLPKPEAPFAGQIGATYRDFKSGLPQAHSRASWRPERSHRHPRRCRFWARWDLRRRRIDTHHGSAGAKRPST